MEPIAFFKDNKKCNYQPWDPNVRRFYDHCKSEGYTFDQCFERVGYLHWWKVPKKNTNSIKKLFRNRHANFVQENLIVDTPSDEDNDAD